MAEQLICNQQVVGSSPIASSIDESPEMECDYQVAGDEERYPSGQREQTVNLPAMPSKVRILPSPPLCCCGNSSVGRAQAFQAWGRGFESRFPLHFLSDERQVMFLSQGHAEL